MIYRRDGLIFFTLQDRAQGEIKIAKVLPGETSNWGAFESQSGNLESLIPEISDEILDRAMRGDATPLMNQGLRDPKGCLKLLKLPSHDCEEKGYCVSYDPKRCMMGHKKMPDCFTPIQSAYARPLILAWLEGFYIIREKD